MDILVLDAPMKVIHGKMVEQGAQEWSRYLMNQFNPIGRGTLYSETYDKVQGLKVYLYSAVITLECVPENKGYLKVVKATETDIETYHKVIEEGKLLEEKITFVPVYKFQYINGKEHHDIEQFMVLEEEKRTFEEYVLKWKSFVGEAPQNQCDSGLKVNEEQLEASLKVLYKGQSANQEMKEFLPEVKNVKVPSLIVFKPEDFSAHYETFTKTQKYILEKALSVQDLYMIRGDAQTVPIIRELVHYVTDKTCKVLIVAPDNEQVEALLGELESEQQRSVTSKCPIEVVRLQSPCDETKSLYSLEEKVNKVKEAALNRLKQEASKYTRHKEELEQMEDECKLYQKAEQTIGLYLEIIAVLEDIQNEKAEIIETSRKLGQEGIRYSESLDEYSAFSKEQHEIYGKIKEALGKNHNLQDEITWMKSHQEAIEYEVYKRLITDYSDAVHNFEERLVAYKKQEEHKKQFEKDYKALETQLLEARRQHLKTEALKQIDPNGDIATDDIVKQEIEELENRLEEMHLSKQNEKAMISTRYLDELKAQVYKLKAQVEVYIAEHKEALEKACSKEQLTKRDVISAFKRMEEVEMLFDREQDYTVYLKGMEHYLELEVKVEENNELMKKQEAIEEKLTGVLKKEQEVMSLLSTKLEETEFKAFVKLIGEETKDIESVIKAPRDKESIQVMEKLKTVIQQRILRLQVYKEKVNFYEGLAKIKEDWKQSLLQETEMLTEYLMKKINVVGTTCSALAEHKIFNLLEEPFEYVIVQHADEIVGLDMIVPLIHGKKVILIGKTHGEARNLFESLYEVCPAENKIDIQTVTEHGNESAPVD